MSCRQRHCRMTDRRAGGAPWRTVTNSATCCWWKSPASRFLRTIAARLVSGYIDDSSNVPDLFLLRFSDEYSTVLDKAGISIGVPVKLIVQQSGPGGPAPLLPARSPPWKRKWITTACTRSSGGLDHSHRLFRGTQGRGIPAKHGRGHRPEGGASRRNQGRHDRRQRPRAAARGPGRHQRLGLPAPAGRRGRRGPVRVSAARCTSRRRRMRRRPRRIPAVRETSRLCSKGA